MTTYVIIDDEPIAHRIIEGYANQMQSLKKEGNCYNALEAIDFLNRISVDLVFLDINMPKLTGFELLKTLSNKPKVIITSAYEEFAIQGYEFDVVDYLLKPFSFERFLKAVNKVSHSPPTTISKISNSEPEYIFIKADKKQYRVVLDTILFIEASGNYCKVYLEDKKLITLKKISDFEGMLPDRFIRVHNSFLIAKDKIEVIEGNSIHMRSHKIPIGHTYKSVIKTLYNE